MTQKILKNLRHYADNVEIFFLVFRMEDTYLYLFFCVPAKMCSPTEAHPPAQLWEHTFDL